MDSSPGAPVRDPFDERLAILPSGAIGHPIYVVTLQDIHNPTAYELKDTTLIGWHDPNGGQS